MDRIIEKYRVMFSIPDNHDSNENFLISFINVIFENILWLIWAVVKGLLFFCRRNPHIYHIYFLAQRWIEATRHVSHIWKSGCVTDVSFRVWNENIKDRRWGAAIKKWNSGVFFKVIFSRSLTGTVELSTSHQPLWFQDVLAVSSEGCTYFQ